MAKRRYSKRRTSKRRYKRRTSRRSSRRSYKRRSSGRRYSKRRSSKRRSSRRKRSYRASGNYGRPCPPGFTRGPSGHCTGSKYNVAQYVNPTFSTAIRNAKSGSNLGFKSRFGSLADAFKARGDKNVYSEGTGTGSRTIGAFAKPQSYTRPTWKDDSGEGPFKLGKVLGGGRRWF